MREMEGPRTNPSTWSLGGSDDGGHLRIASHRQDRETGEFADDCEVSSLSL